MNAEDTWVYGNTFYGNSGDGLRSVLMLRGNTHPLGATLVVGNLFLDNVPTKGGYGTFLWLRDPLPDAWTFERNLFSGNTAASDVPYTGEPGSLYERDPLLAAPAVPSVADPSVERIAEIQAWFTLGAGSPAEGAGVDVVGLDGHPDWHPGRTDVREDMQGDPRAEGGAWDLGADER
jgi:hypothetical protein